MPISTKRSNGKIRVTFALPARDDTGRISVVGDFNDWIPGSNELRTRSNGTRSASVLVQPGTTLCFRYLTERLGWLDDPDVAQRDERGCLYSV